MRSYPPEKRWDGTGKTPENRRGCTVVKIKPAAIIEAEFGDFALEEAEGIEDAEESAILVTA